MQWDRIIWESDNILKIDRESTNVRNRKERIPKRRATTSVLNVVTNITTAKKASPVLSTKPRPSAPVIGDSVDMGEGERKRFARGKGVTVNNLFNNSLTGGDT